VPDVPVDAFRRLMVYIYKGSGGLDLDGLTIEQLFQLKDAGKFSLF
jgi:hypothetical protein